MNIVTTTAVMPYDRPTADTLAHLKEIGFTHFDLGLDTYGAGSWFRSDKWEEGAYRLKEAVEKLGVVLSHSHSFSEKTPAGDDLVFRCLRVCSILGVPCTVVHERWQKAPGEYFYDEDEFLAFNENFYAPILEEAEKLNVTVLAENLLWGCTIYPNMMVDLVKRMKSDRFGWCFDTGHAHACKVLPESIADLSLAPLSLHMQDNHGEFNDEHLLPGDGTINWEKFLAALKTVGYKGDLVLEAHHQPLEAKTDEERDAIIKDLYARAVKMRDHYENGTKLVLK